MKSKLTIVISFSVFVFFVWTYFFFKQVQEDYLSITTFEQCVQSGYPVLTTYPEQCKIPGKIFTNTTQSTSTSKNVDEATTSPERNMNPKNSSYSIDEQKVSLHNGIYVTATTSSSTSKFQYFGNELRVDLDEDNTEDSAFLLTSESSGTGRFYYVVVALNANDGYVGINGILIGDRIIPQSTEYKNNEIVVTYLDRQQDEPMSKKPSFKNYRYFKVMNSTLVEIIK